jgi:exosome complex exonuclease DIS3/RRP44
VTFTKDTHDFDPENYVLNVPRPDGTMAVIGVFDRVVVDIEIEKDPNTLRGKVKMTLVSPVSSVGL